jgi:hypothetical protein
MAEMVVEARVATEWQHLLWAQTELQILAAVGVVADFQCLLKQTAALAALVLSSSSAINKVRHE